MEKNNLVRRSHCAISSALEVIGDRWSLIILRDLMFTEKRSYGELQSCEEKIATNILAARLVALEENGIIYKITDPENGRRSLYYLTEKGIDLLPVIIELRKWMEKHDADVEPCQYQLSFTNASRAKVLSAYQDKLRKLHITG